MTPSRFFNSFFPRVDYLDPHALFETIFEGTDNAIMIFGADGVVLCANHRVDQLFQVEAGSLAGKDCKTFFEAGESASFSKIFEAAQKNKNGWSGELKAKRGDGTLFFMEVRVKVIPCKSSPSYMFIGRDISPLKSLKKEVVQEQQSVQELKVTLKTVLSTVEEEKLEAKGQVVQDVKEQILPVLENISSEITKQERASLVHEIEASLENIAENPLGPQANTDWMLKLTPAELDVCRLVRSGATSQQIAHALHSSQETIQTHRKSLRKKLKLKGRKISLCSYLQNMPLPK